MREGIYNFGRLDKNSGTLDARNLEKEKIVKAQKRNIKKRQKKRFRNLHERLIHEYGETLTFNIYEKAIKKLLIKI